MIGRDTDSADSTALVDTRTVSTVAPQALFLLNNPFILAQTKALARRLLADLDQSVDRTRLVAQGQVGRLRVGFADTATYSGVLPTLLRDFRARWPDVAQVGEVVDFILADAKQSLCLARRRGGEI